MADQGGSVSVTETTLTTTIFNPSPESESRMSVRRMDWQRVTIRLQACKPPHRFLGTGWASLLSFSGACVVSLLLYPRPADWTPNVSEIILWILTFSTAISGGFVFLLDKRQGDIYAETIDNVLEDMLSVERTILAHHELADDSSQSPSGT